MMSPMVACILSSLLLGSNPESLPYESVTLSGKALLLPEALKSAGLDFDVEPVAQQVVIVGTDGAIQPILSDVASRALFLDKRLRGRRLELHGRRYTRNPYIQVVSFQVEDHGRLRTPEYFCDVCTISVRYPQICPCCQGPMVLRMRPDRE